MSSDTSRILEKERKNLKDRIFAEASNRDTRLQCGVEVAVQEVACALNKKIVAFEADFNGKSHAKKSGIICKVSFENDCSISYEYCEARREPFLNIKVRFGGVAITFTPENIDRISRFREFFGDEERNDFSTVDARMCAKAWRQCAACFGVLDVVQFAQYVFDFYVKIIALLHSDRGSISMDAFIPNVFVTKLIEVNVCTKADVCLKLPEIHDAVLTPSEENEKVIEIQDLPPKKQDDLSESVLSEEKSAAYYALTARFGELVDMRDDLLQDRDLYQVMEPEAVDDYHHELKKLNREIEEINQILSHIRGFPVDVKGVTVKVFQNDNWFEAVNDAVMELRKKKKNITGKDLKSMRQKVKQSDLWGVGSIYSSEIGDRLDRLSAIETRIEERGSDPLAHEREGVTKQMFSREGADLQRQRDSLKKEIEAISMKAKAEGIILEY